MTAVEGIWDEVCRLYAVVPWAPYDQRIQALESDMCSLTSEADEFDSRANEVHKRQKTRTSKMATERDRIARLQCKLDEARSSLDQQAKEAVDASEEEVSFAGEGSKLRQSISSKAKEVERFGFGFGLAFLCGFLAKMWNSGFAFEFDLAHFDGAEFSELD
ncbi:hypothetical protein Taro_017100 [Colocasia esculenta]|uniref:Uncharacterized protein n=1 Tax=Colocasia esculenta TaxID=4460 RepID=A0A843UFG5_COLES|nr:hypothetical protein [Colocasia esculenta]